MRHIKYDSIKSLPDNALPVSLFAKQFDFKSASYVHVKYDRYKFGYKNKRGETLFASYPGYDIINFKGNCYVINYSKKKVQK